MNAHPIALWLQQDAAEKVIRLLRKATDDPELVRTQLPQGWTRTAKPVITVVSDGTPISEPGWTKEFVRITVHGFNAPTVRKIMTSIDAVMVTPAPWRLFRTTPATGLIVSKDSRVGGWLASATYGVVTSRKEKKYGSQ